MRLRAALLASVAVVGREEPGIQSPAAAKPVAEFVRLVHCGPGWRLVVYESGDARQQVDDTCLRPRSYAREYKFRANELDALRAAIVKARFNELPDEVTADTVVPDEDAFVISVWNGETAKRVLARGLDRATSDEARRFRMVWDTTARVVPDPGADPPQDMEASRGACGMRR